MIQSSIHLVWQIISVAVAIMVYAFNLSLFMLCLPHKWCFPLEGFLAKIPKEILKLLIFTNGMLLIPRNFHYCINWGQRLCWISILGSMEPMISFHAIEYKTHIQSKFTKTLKDTAYLTKSIEISPEYFSQKDFISKPWLSMIIWSKKVLIILRLCTATKD